MQMGLFFGLVCVALRLGFPLALPDEIGQLHNTNNTCTRKIAGVEVLSNLSAFAATNCSRRLGPERPMRVLVGFAAGATSFFVIKPTEVVTSGLVLRDRRMLLCWSDCLAGVGLGGPAV